MRSTHSSQSIALRVAPARHSGSYAPVFAFYYYAYAGSAALEVRSIDD